MVYPMYLFMGALVVGTSIWVGVDAGKRDWARSGSGGTSPAAWVVGCLLLWIVIFPLYLIKRGNVQLKDGVGSVAVAATAPAAPVGPTMPPAGWYRDPHNAESLRYWNGIGWTSNTATPSAPAST